MTTRASDTIATSPPEAAVAANKSRPAYGWWVLLLLSLAYMLSFIDRQILSVMVDPIKSELGISDFQMGILQGIAFAVFYATLGIPIAKIADFGNRRNLICAGLALWSIATTVAGLVRGYPAFLGMRMLVGVGEATLGPAAYSIFADLFNRLRLARVIGIFHAASGASIGLSVVIGSSLLSFFGSWDERPAILASLSPWRLTLITVGLPGLLLALIILITVREPRRRALGALVQAETATRGTKSVGSVLRTILVDRRGVYWKLILGSALMSLYGFGSLAWFPAHLSRADIIEPDRIGSTLGVVLTFAGLTGPLAGGFLADWLQQRRQDAALPALLALAACAVVPAALAPSMSHPAVVLALFWLGFALFAATIPLLPVAIQLLAPPQMRARVSAVWLCVNNIIGLGLGPVLVAGITQYVLADPAELGRSIALAGTTATVAAAVMFAAATRSLSMSR